MARNVQKHISEVFPTSGCVGQNLWAKFFKKCGCAKQNFGVPCLGSVLLVKYGTSQGWLCPFTIFSCRLDHFQFRLIPQISPTCCLMLCSQPEITLEISICVPDKWMFDLWSVRVCGSSQEGYACCLFIWNARPDLEGSKFWLTF